MSDDAKAKALEEKELGNALYKKRQFDEALEHYDKAFELDPSNITILTNKAAVLFEKEDYEGCAQICQQAVDIGREQRADFKLIAKAYARMGNAQHKIGDLAAAIKAYEKSLTEHRTSDTLQKLRDVEKLKAQHEKEAYYNPELAEQARERGNDLFKSSNWAGAITEYTEAIKRNDKDPKAYSNRAACYLKLLALNEALKDAEKSIELDSNFVRGYTRKASIEAARKEYNKCIETCLEAREKDTDGKNAREINQLLQKAYIAIGQTNQNESPEEILKRAQQDPEIQSILNDPVMQQILNQMQQDPAAAQDHLKNPLIASKIRKLIASGILKIA